MIVADSNLIAYLLIPGDKSVIADEIFLKDPDWAVPLICRSEIRNILTLYMRHEKMTLVQAQATMEKAERLWREHEYSVPSNDVLALTHKHNVTAYDGEFVVLAQELGVPLITFDKAVKRLFPKIAIEPKEYLKL
ncbi:MAG TPA: type II toxin-antitoxin system VapC family toxin [Kiritimatiellia bacterium]|nr:type II toxin-antitoxin system VapC family toxin [Kiritimatiellia bacterium]